MDWGAPTLTVIGNTFRYDYGTMTSNPKVNNIYIRWGIILMAAGLQVYRDDGVVLQIDESFINLQFIRKGTIQLNAKNPTNLSTNWMYNTLTVSSLTAIVAIRCPYPVYINVSAVNNGSVTYEYFVNNAAGATLEYWIYDTASTTSGNTAGLQVFDASGVLIFD